MVMADALAKPRNQDATLHMMTDVRLSAGGNAAVRYGYDPKNCVLNATDVMLDQMMYSVPAQQMLAGAGSGTADERAARLLASFDAPVTGLAGL